MVTFFVGQSQRESKMCSNYSLDILGRKLIEAFKSMGDFSQTEESLHCREKTVVLCRGEKQQQKIVCPLCVRMPYLENDTGTRVGGRGSCKTC